MPKDSSLTTEEIKDRLRELLEKEHLFAKYFIHQPNGKFTEVATGREFFNSDNPRHAVIVLYSFKKDKEI